MCVYNNCFNTVGVGDPVPYGMNSLGSGDRFDLGPFKKPFKKQGIKTIKAYSQYKPAKQKTNYKTNHNIMKPQPILVYKKKR